MDTYLAKKLDEVLTVPYYYDISRGQPMEIQLNSVTLKLAKVIDSPLFK